VSDCAEIADDARDVPPTRQRHESEENPRERPVPGPPAGIGALINPAQRVASATATFDCMAPAQGIWCNDNPLCRCETAAF